MKLFLNLFRKRDGAKVLGRVHPADALLCSSMGADPLFVRPAPKPAKPKERPADFYPFQSGKVADRILKRLAHGVEMASDSSRYVAGGAGSNGDRRLRAAKAWLKAAGYEVREREIPSKKGGRPSIAVSLAPKSANRLKAFFRERDKQYLLQLCGQEAKR